MSSQLGVCVLASIALLRKPSWHQVVGGAFSVRRRGFLERIHRCTLSQTCLMVARMQHAAAVPNWRLTLERSASTEWVENLLLLRDLYLLRTWRLWWVAIVWIHDSLLIVTYWLWLGLSFLDLLLSYCRRGCQARVVSNPTPWSWLRWRTSFKILVCCLTCLRGNVVIGSSRVQRINYGSRSTGCKSMCILYLIGKILRPRLLAITAIFCR